MTVYHVSIEMNCKIFWIYVYCAIIPVMWSIIVVVKCMCCKWLQASYFLISVWNNTITQHSMFIHFHRSFRFFFTLFYHLVIVVVCIIWNVLILIWHSSDWEEYIFFFSLCVNCNGQITWVLNYFRVLNVGAVINIYA